MGSITFGKFIHDEDDYFIHDEVEDAPAWGQTPLEIETWEVQVDSVKVRVSTDPDYNTTLHATYEAPEEIGLEHPLHERVMVALGWNNRTTSWSSWNGFWRMTTS